VAGQHHKHQAFGGLLMENRRNFMKYAFFLGFWESELVYPKVPKYQCFEY
jgi:hypothetical protein